MKKPWPWHLRGRSVAVEGKGRTREKEKASLVFLRPRISRANERLTASQGNL